MNTRNVPHRKQGQNPMDGAARAIKLRTTKTITSQFRYLLQ
jgi:hypothetical protein